jgi:hypothetical protein
MLSYASTAIDQQNRTTAASKKEKKQLTQKLKERSIQGSWEHDLTAAMLVIDAV